MQNKTRKKYEANKTLAQTYLRNGLIAAGIVFVGLLLFGFGRNVYLLFASPDQDGALIWSTIDGIGYSDKGGTKNRVYKVGTRTGEIIKNPKFCVRGNALIYWSPEDKAICVLESGKSEKWIDLGVQLGDSHVLDLRPSKQGVLLVGYDSSTYDEYLPGVSAVADVELDTSMVFTLEPKDQMIDPKSGKTVFRDGSGFKSSGGSSYSAPSQVASWDFDFAKGRLVVDEGKAIHVKGGKEEPTFGLGMIYFMRSSKSSRPGEVWVQAVKPFKAGFMLVSFGQEGDFRKLQVKDEKPINPPYVKPNAEIVGVLDGLTRKYGE